MWRREFDRLPVKMNVKYVNGTTEHMGTLLNLSEKGMFISSRVHLPMKPQINVFIPVGNDTLRVTARIRSFGVGQNYCRGLGVEIIKPPQKYIDFISVLRTAAKRTE